MIIFNNTEMSSKYTISDDMIFEINSTKSLDDIYAAICNGEDVSQIAHIDVYRNGDGKVNLECDNMPNNAVVEGVKLGSVILPRTESLETVEENISGKMNQRPAIFKALEQFKWGLKEDGYDIKIQPFNTDNKQHLEVLRKHIALARGCSPMLYDVKNEDGSLKFKTISEMRKLSNEGDNLYRYLGPGSIAKDNKLPTIEEREDFLKLTEYEKRLLTNSDVHPAKIMKFKKELEEKIGKGAVITSDMINSFSKSFNEELHLPHKDVIDAYRDAFTEEFKKQNRGRAPRIVDEYIEGIISSENKSTFTNEEIEKYVSAFKLPLMQTIVIPDKNDKSKGITLAQTKNPALIYLTTKLPLNEYPQQLIRFLATYVNNKNAAGLQQIGFNEWINKNKKCNITDLQNLFDKPDTINKILSKGMKLDVNKSLKDNCLKVYYEQAFSDMKHYESSYNYKFKDNEVAIKGRNIVVTENGVKIYMLPADDMRQFTVANTENTHCCQHWGGAGSSCVAKYTSDPFASCVIVEDKNGQIQAQGFVWVDVEQDCFVFDNIEYHRDQNAKLYTNLIQAYIEALPYSEVQIGMGYVESAGTAWNGVGEPWNAKMGFPAANMPKTTAPTAEKHIYSDYHPDAKSYSAARVVKHKGEMLRYNVNHKNIKIDNKPDEPTRWDILANGDLKFMLNAYQKSIEDRVRFAEEFLTNPTKEAQKAVFEINPTAILTFDNPDPECQIEVFKKHPDIAKQIKNPCKELQAEIIKDDPSYLRTINNPDAELLEAVVSTDGMLLSLCENPTPVLCDKAVSNNGYALKYVPEELKTEDILIKAVEKTPKVVSLYITNPSDEVQMAAVRKDPTVVLLIKDPCVRAQMSAVAKQPDLILQMKNPDYAVIKTAVEHSPKMIKKYQFEYPDLKENAIRQNPFIIKDICKPTIEEYDLAISINPNVGRFVQRPVVENENILDNNPVMEEDGLEIG